MCGCSKVKAKSGQFTQAHRGHGHGRLESSPARNPVPWAGQLVSPGRLPCTPSRSGLPSVEGYPCAHLEPGRQLVRPGAIAQPKVVCHHVAGIGQLHVLKQNGDSRPPSVLNPDPVDGGGEAVALPHEGGQAVTHLSCAAAAIPRRQAGAGGRATGTFAGLGRCRSARTSCGLVRSGDIRPAVAGSAAARSTGPTAKARPAPCATPGRTAPR